MTEGKVYLMIEVRNLTKKYGSTVAVDNLSFSVEEGEIYGFLGPNGAGKSTTMNIITGYIAATEGEVLINGFDILRDAKKAKSMIGYLPEMPPLYQDMTVREYLTFAAELKGIPKSEIEQAIDISEKTVQIADVSGRLIKNLSKGYKQRVGFAQALLGLPEVLILDEPTVGLDPKQIIEIRDLIRELGKNHTIILSSHILSEVSAICDKIMIISQGKLIASDTPENLMNLMQPVVRLHISLRAERRDAESVLSSMEGISRYEISESEEEGVLSAEVEYEHGADLRDRIALAFAEAKCLVVGLREETASLEDIFLELTKPESKNPSELIAESERKSREYEDGDPAGEESGLSDPEEELDVPEAEANPDVPGVSAGSGNLPESEEEERRGSDL